MSHLNFVCQVPISKLKSNYIPADCVRIANQLGMPYGSIFDVGVDIKMVEICLKLFMFAQHQNKEKEYTLAMATAIWANGVDIEITLKHADMDCTGVCFGGATVDVCGMCSDGATVHSR